MSVPWLVAYVSKLLSVCAMVVTAYWLGDTHDTEPVVALLASLAAYLVADWQTTARGTVSGEGSTPDAHDRLLFTELLSDLPSNGEVLRFLSEQDLGFPFQYDPISELERIADRWKDAEHEFLDDELQSLKQRLFELARTFARETAVKTRPLGGGRVTVGMSDYENDPEKYALVEYLNKLGWQVYEAHQELVRVARRKLPPSPPLRQPE